MGHGWAMDGPQVGLGQALGDTIFGQSLVFMSNICLANVQPLTGGGQATSEWETCGPQVGHGRAMSGPQVGHRWATGGPWAGPRRAIYGQSLIYMSNICFAFVQP